MAIDRESDEFQGKECAVKLEGYKWQLKFEGFFFFFPGCVARHAESLVPQPDSLVPPEWNHGTGLPGNSPNVVFKIMIYMTCTSGTQLLEINQNGDETEGCKKPAQ